MDKLGGNMKLFLRDLAEVLEKHGASIEASARFIPYEQDGQTVEFTIPGDTIDLDESYVYPCTLLDLIEMSD